MPVRSSAAFFVETIGFATSSVFIISITAPALTVIELSHPVRIGIGALLFEPIIAIAFVLVITPVDGPHTMGSNPGFLNYP